ncbi:MULTISPECIES: Dabb family protein [Crateriforma]|uniref:Stress responsive A/B Barrel Domain protein n=1 Tax=Crateriforma conspicua TaxID=2527996 RepID=A0A5C6G0J2_9PLAN|nr:MULTISPECIES: Dabb family protein [Crateriforma]TWU66773.1 Stress responsive A/B Barrel Domain protein [Crateriforma conspicua]
MARLAHHVFFTLKDRSEESVARLVAACQKYLGGHDGMVGFEVGTRESDYQRPVNQDYDVSLYTVFVDRAAHDAYQQAERHLQFIAETKETWAEVRVFDSNLTEMSN